MRKTYRTIFKLLRELKPEIVAEIGVFGGGLCRVLLHNCPYIKEYWAVDPWMVYSGSGAGSLGKYNQENWEGLHEIFKKNCMWSDKCHELRMTSIEAAKQFPKGYFDFVYIDADHTYKSELADIQAWLPLIKNGGVLAGHDYTKRQKGVIKAVNDSFGNDFKILGKTTIWVKYVNNNLDA